jgi:hypothetical protein
VITFTKVPFFEEDVSPIMTKIFEGERDEE